MDALLVCHSNGKILLERYFEDGRVSPANENPGALKRADETGGGVPSRGLAQRISAGAKSWVSSQDTSGKGAVVAFGSRVAVRVARRDLIFIALASSDTLVAPLVETLERAADNLHQLLAEKGGSGASSGGGESAGQSLETLISRHMASTVVYLDEMILNGLPVLLQPDALRTLVPRRARALMPADLLEPLANVFGHGASSRLDAAFASSTTAVGEPGYGMGTGSGAGLGSGLLGSGSNVWWRYAAVPPSEYSLRAEHVERLHCHVDARTDAVSNVAITGAISVSAALPGLPLCQLTFKNALATSSLSHNPLEQGVKFYFHPAVNLNAWKRSRSLHFTPPESTFQLLAYTLLPPLQRGENSSSERSLSSSLSSMCPPLSLSATFTFNAPRSDSAGSESTTGKGSASAGRFSLAISPREAFGSAISRQNLGSVCLENVKVSVVLPRSIRDATFGEVTSGSAAFVPSQHSLVWTFARLPLQRHKGPSRSDLQDRVLARCDGLLFGGKKREGTIGSVAARSESDTMSPVVVDSRSQADGSGVASSSSGVEDSVHLQDTRLTARLHFMLNGSVLSDLAVDSIEVMSLGGQSRGSTCQGNMAARAHSAASANLESSDDALESDKWCIRSATIAGHIEYHL